MLLLACSVQPGVLKSLKLLVFHSLTLYLLNACWIMFWSERLRNYLAEPLNSWVITELLPAIQEIIVEWYLSLELHIVLKFIHWTVVNTLFPWSREIEKVWGRGGGRLVHMEGGRSLCVRGKGSEQMSQNYSTSSDIYLHYVWPWVHIFWYVLYTNLMLFSALQDLSYVINTLTHMTYCQTGDEKLAKFCRLLFKDSSANCS